MNHGLHDLILRPTTTFRNGPVYVFTWCFDAAALTMDAVLRVDDELFLLRGIILYILVDASRTKALLGPCIFLKGYILGNVRQFRFDT